MKKTQKSFNSTIRGQSDKQRALETRRAKAKAKRIDYLMETYGIPICEYCGARGLIGGDELNSLDMHEIDGNHQNCDSGNVYICHRKCHSYITDSNIVVSQEDFQSRQLFM